MRRTLAFFLFVGVSSIAPCAPPTDPAARYEQMIQAGVADKVFMGSVLVARDGAIVLDKGYGFANLDWNVANTPATKFRLGSITKQFTAASILLLAERGKLDIDDPVKKYLADAPAAWDKVTLAELLSHTAGIPNFTDFPDYPASEAQPTTPQALVARFRDKPLDFEPGSQFRYSNSGYVLLGYLLEKISGQSYEDFVAQNIFAKLEMHDSGYDSTTRVIPRHASGYAPGDGGIVNAGYVDMSIPFSAGALYSTTGDLLKWEQGLFGGRVISAASLKKMTTPHKEDYGFGLKIGSEQGHPVFEHGGGIEGFNTHMAYYPDDKTVVIVLANLNGMAADNLARGIGVVSQGGSVVLPWERKAVTLPRATLQQYVGVYAFAPDYKIEISFAGDGLVFRMTGQPQAELFAESADAFFVKQVDARITFAKNARGAIESLTIHQDGQEHTAKKEAAAATGK